jgi:hypothetical protein
MKEKFFLCLALKGWLWLDFKVNLDGHRLFQKLKLASLRKYEDIFP